MSKELLKPNLCCLEELFTPIYDVPVYQRPYSWDKDQIDVLLFDIFNSYESENKNDGYYTGNIIVYDKNEGNDGIGMPPQYSIIDGQQRISTFALILLALYCISIERKIETTDVTLNTIKKSLWKVVRREYHKELKTITLNSIDKKCFSDLYNECFDRPNTIVKFCETYQCTSHFDERIINNFLNIYSTLKNKIPSSPADAVLDFADYILQYIHFIVIESNCRENKVFSMFESINSKGKHLEDIDLIKTYIFSKLDEASYNDYLEKWGQLIIKTEDKLYDYLYNYIKAYLCFYRQNITITNFKAVSKKELLIHFKVADETSALKKLLDDLYDKVEYYNMLSSAEKAYELVKSTKFRFYYKIFTEISYKHPKALFLRTLIEYKEGKITKEDAVEIISQTTSFMMKVLTISGKDSKDTITMFSNIMNDIYKRDMVNKDTVMALIAAELVRQGITQEKLKSDLNSIDAYEKNKTLTIALLSLYEATIKDEDGTTKISYDQAYTILNSFSKTFSLDHLLVQTPEKDSENFKYYKDEEKEILRLKEGHDFPESIVVEGMDYETFTRMILNQIGNLRIYYRDKNSGRGNTLITLKEYPNFYSYANIKQRGKEIVDMLIDNCLPHPNVDLTKLQIIDYKKEEDVLPKMDKLMEFGIVKPGDKLYITVNPDHSVATVLDDKYVQYNGKKMTLNEWGCKITGWKSIRIYSYAALVGELETLQQKRMQFIENNNETIN